MKKDARRSVRKKLFDTSIQSVLVTFLLMPLVKEQKTEVIRKFQICENDTGSSEVQIALLSERINGLAKHFEAHVKDHASRRGLLKMVGRRRKLLAYLKKHNEGRYKKLIDELGIRK